MTHYQIKKVSCPMPAKRAVVLKWLLSTSARVVLAAGIVVATVVYIVQTTSISVIGYDISEHQKQVANLKRENQRLEVAIAEHRSLKSIEERLPALAMVTDDRPDYITLADTAMARR
ncbi:MAG: hypothetical protein HY984_01265 [Candidatus Magasanikbacteria bacterium]|nr:hypothetical protein [Candidatus Magasanikbacteria bacterium]